VLLLERDLAQPDRIVGELLQPGGYLALKRLGLAHCTEGIDAQRVEGYALHMSGRYARVAYPLDGPMGAAAAAINGAGAPAPPAPAPLGADVAGRSFHHGRFVQRLRAAAASCPTLTIREASVRRLIGADGGEWSGDEAQPVAGVEYRPTGSGSGSGSGSGATASNGGGGSAGGGGGGVKRLFSFGRRQGSVGGGGGNGSGEQQAPPSSPSSSTPPPPPPQQTRVARAHLTVVCDGMYSTFRRSLVVPNAPDGSINVRHPSFFVGVVLEGVALPHPNHGHVVLARPSPILFYPISSTEVRCLVDVPSSKLPRDLPGYLRDVVAPGVPVELRAAFLRAVDKAADEQQQGGGGGASGGGSGGKGALRSMQNKQLTTSPVHPPGALLLGDAFNMRHPLTGGGMTVALSDVRLLCDMLAPLPDYRDPLATAEATASFYTARKPVSATINTLANALYKVFCPKSGDQAQEEMRAACFDYLALGGTCASGPVALLSGLNPSPAALVSHFFSVALFGVGRLVAPRPTVRGVWLAAALLVAASRIILPIVWSEGPRAVFAPALAPKPVGAIKKVAEKQRQRQREAGGSSSAGGVGGGVPVSASTGRGVTAAAVAAVAAAAAAALLA
jgi:squalene monooxygenase